MVTLCYIVFAVSAGATKAFHYAGKPNGCCHLHGVLSACCAEWCTVCNWGRLTAPTHLALLLLPLLLLLLHIRAHAAACNAASTAVLSGITLVAAGCSSSKTASYKLK
jgi:hypothetical protein